jgi:hypothetical protein
MEGRHVGLDFYDLLIEALIRLRPATLPLCNYLAKRRWEV